MKEFYKQIIKHLEILVEQNDVNTNIFLIKRGDKLTGFQFANDVEKVVLRNGEYIEQGTIFDLYIRSKSELGINDRSSTIRILRLAKKLTQDELAKKVDKTRYEISRWENGTKPSDDITEVILQHLNK